MGLILIKTGQLPLLIPNHMEYRTAAHTQTGRHGKQGCRLHLGGQHPKPFPCLPLLLQLVGHGHAPGGMLTVEGILTLDHTGMPALTKLVRRLCQRLQYPVIGHGRELNGGVFPAGPLHTHRAGGDHHIVAAHIQLDPAAGAHPDKGVRPDLYQLLHGDSRGGAADPGGYHADLFSQQGAGVGHILPVGGHMDRTVKISGDLFAPTRISGQNAVATHIPRCTLDMILKLPFLHSEHLACHMIVDYTTFSRFFPSRKP